MMKIRNKCNQNIMPKKMNNFYMSTFKDIFLQFLFSSFQSIKNKDIFL